MDTASAANIKTALLLPGRDPAERRPHLRMCSRLAGVVESVSANLGQVVKKGQVLAAIASPTASEQRSELQTAQKRLALAKTTYEREKKLWEQKVSAEQDYLQAKQALSEAEVAMANADQKLECAGSVHLVGAGLESHRVACALDGIVIEKHLSLGEAVKEDTAVFTISDLNSGLG